MSEAEKKLRIEFSERTKPIVFWIGAGVSAPLLPGWSDLRDRLIVRAREIAEQMRPQDRDASLEAIKQILNINDIWVQFNKLQTLLRPEQYSSVIKDALAKSEHSAIPYLHNRLWSLVPTGIISLNLDLFSQRASASDPRGTVPIQILPGDFGRHLNVLKERRPFIAYPHGHLDAPDSWTFTKAELDRRLQDPDYQEWLSIIFRVATVVFVGVTADDVAIGSPLARMVSKQGHAPLTGNYWITARDDRTAFEWGGDNGVTIVSYANDARDHRQLGILLDDLVNPVREEDPSKETPVIMAAARNAVTSELDIPQGADQSPEEKLRLALNTRAAQILRGESTDGRDQEYDLFIKGHAKEIYAAWYASVEPGDNQFFGYSLAEELTGGAFGAVYKAYGKQGEPVAIKVLRADNFRKPGFYKNFRRGANSLRILSERHVPGVIGYLDAAEIPPTIVMEWSDGRNLSELVESGALKDWGARIRVAHSLAKIIRDCHSLPERVLHRDLRPANVMVERYYEESEEWVVKVLDFDLSWHKGAEGYSIMHSPAFGYLAPEQKARGRYTTRNALVDSYGFGMTLYFMCSGRNPHPDQHLTAAWQEDVFRAVEASRLSQWLSAPKRIARLIVSATMDNQPDRISIPQIEGELESLLVAATTSDPIPLVDVITEELAARTEHMFSYVWKEADSAAILRMDNGLNLALRTIIGTRNIKFSAGWLNSGAQNWNHIDRMMSQALPKLESALRELGVGVGLHKQKSGFEISCEFNADNVRTRVREFAGRLDDAIKHASSIANF